MRKTLIASLLVVAVSAAALLIGAVAEGKSPKANNPFKGKWDVVLTTPLGTWEVTTSLQPNGKGTLWLGQGSKVPVVHQETETWISWTIELPAVQAPDGNAHTIIGRGTLDESGETMSGNLVIVTAKDDAENPTGYETHVGTFSAPKR